ncbi:hypothetical protein [Sciscionella marina]|uniref:hypothetical protein n=1 Tax=Sciscionella marina TaxID=508770 RepID=UPI0012F6A991|nr:hypothetical protein [Sciscionella marina]
MFEQLEDRVEHPGWIGVAARELDRFDVRRGGAVGRPLQEVRTQGPWDGLACGTATPT